MKRFALVGLALVVVLAVGSAWAHPPKDVKMEYDPASKVLTVTAPHDTKDAAKHFISAVEVERNGEKIIEQKFKAQINGDVQQARFWINDAGDGDTLIVTAACNIAGKKKATFVIAKPEAKPAAEPVKTD